VKKVEGGREETGREAVEAKKLAIDIDDDKDAISQAKQHAWNSTILFAVLTDFEQFRLYDTTLRPIPNASTRGWDADLALDHDGHESQWDVVTATF